MKLISDSYLYQTADYNKELFKYIMEAERVDKNSKAEIKVFESTEMN